MILCTSIHHYLLSSLLLFYFVDVECDATFAFDTVTIRGIPATTKYYIPSNTDSKITVNTANIPATQDPRLGAISTQSTNINLGDGFPDIDTGVSPDANGEQTISIQSTTKGASPVSLAILQTITTTSISTNKEINATTFPDSSNSTSPPRKTKKYSVLLIFLLISIGLAALVLIASLVVYVLIKQGRIRVFNRSRASKKANEHGRMADSSSIDDRGSPSQKEMDIN